MCSSDLVLRALNPVLVALRPERRKQTQEPVERHRGSRLVWWLGAALSALLLALVVLRFACAGGPA